MGALGRELPAQPLMDLGIGNVTGDPAEIEGVLVVLQGNECMA